MGSTTLAGKVAIVSGSARGIGAAICIELASKGANVVVNYPWQAQQGDAQGVLDQIREATAPFSPDCIAVEADISTRDGPSQLVAKTVERFGPKIDILVNNAGIAIMKSLQDFEVEQWDAQVNLNARGTLLLTKATLPYLANPSRIVNISSVGARQGYEGSAVYNGTKSMIESFTRCWAIELGRSHGCTVNAIAPGPTNTLGFNHAGPDFLKKLQPLLDATPMGSRMAEPAEHAFAVGFLCEDRAGWITGVSLGTSGGFHMS